MIAITVYTKPRCVQCDATKRALDKAGITYDVVDIESDIQALDTILAMGYQQAPVVITDQEHWSGHRPGRIQDLARRTA